MKRWIIGFSLILAGTLVSARVYVTLEDLTARLFPAATLEAETLYLSPEQKAEAEAAAGSPLPGPVLHTQRILRDGKELGRVYLDRHLVRTLPETVAVVLSPEGRVISVEVLAFSEPETYKPRPAWLALFQNREPATLPRYKQEIDGITGATLTGRAVTNAVRRALAVHAVRTP